MQTETTQIIHAPNVGHVNSLDNEQVWLRYQAFEPPCSPDETLAVQKEIDSIIGTTRDNKSIAKLAWNGDVRYWKQFHDCWETAPPHRPIGEPVKRPQVLYKSVFSDDDVFQFDAFPPRWLIMTRIEPEQYMATWARDSKFAHPDYSIPVQILPAEAPSERHVWFMTIAAHVPQVCCRQAEIDDHTCWGKYAHPRHALEELRNIRKGMEASGIADSRPFDSPDRLAERLRERGINDYAEQAMNKFLRDRKNAIDMAPLASASPGTLQTSADLKQLRARLIEQGKRDGEILEKDLRKREKLAR